MSCEIIIGAQYGDEAKGKYVFDKIIEWGHVHEQMYCVRFNGGANAGHSIYINNILYDTHVLPSG